MYGGVVYTLETMIQSAWTALTAAGASLSSTENAAELVFLKYSGHDGQVCLCDYLTIYVSLDQVRIVCNRIE